MKNNIKFIFSCIFLATILPDLNAQNSIFLGGVEEDMGNSIKQFESRFYIVGTTRKTSKNATDYYILELNNKGGLEHQYIFGGPHIDVGKDIIVREDGIFVLGKSENAFNNIDSILSYGGLL